MGSMCFGVLFNVKGKNLFFSGLGGGLGWFSYELLSYLGLSNSSYALFIATIVMSVYSEIMARVLKQPVTIFVVSAMIPLVPGSGMYYTTFAAVTGDLAKCLTVGVKTFYDAGSIAIAIIFVSTLARILKFNNKKSISNLSLNMDIDGSIHTSPLGKDCDDIFIELPIENSSHDIDNDDE